MVQAVSVRSVFLTRWTRCFHTAKFLMLFVMLSLDNWHMSSHVWRIAVLYPRHLYMSVLKATSYVFGCLPFIFQIVEMLSPFLAAWFTCLWFWHSSLAQLLGMWDCPWCTFSGRFSTLAAMSCHSTEPKQIYLCCCSTPTFCHQPRVSIERDCWPLFSFNSIWSKMDGFCFCKMASPASFFHSFWNVLHGNP